MKKSATRSKKDKPTRDAVVVDTSVVLFDADSVFGFGGYDIVIPLVVLDEVDKFRSLDSEVGRNARRFIRHLKELGANNRSLSKGVDRLESGEKLYVKFVGDRRLFDHSVHIDLRRNDDIILAVCLEMKQEAAGKHNVLLSTKDISLSVRANVLGIDTIEYRNDAGIKNVNELYTGIVTLDVDAGVIDELYSRGGVKCPAKGIYENSGIVLRSHGQEKSGLGIYKNGFIHRLRNTNKKISSIVPKNAEQEIAAELILDPSVQLLTLTGPAGTGKTLLAIAGGIQLAINNDLYDRVVVSRPVQPLGKDLGYLPGDVYDKMAPWIGPIKDAVEVVLGDSTRFDDLLSFGKMDIEPLTYIRGRSIPRTFFILDESQNITQHEMKAIISRMGHGSKIVLTGDILQIDNHYLDPVTNGLTVVVETFKESYISGHVTLTKGQRSELATLAAEML